jgi:glucose-6-phosphate dehydrogenase assembly protein OpcA
LPGQEEGNQYRSLMYIAWLAVQLEWEPVRGLPGSDVAHLQFRDKRGEQVDAEVALMPQSSPQSQSIQKIAISSHVGSQKNQFAIERDHEHHLMNLIVNKGGAESVLRKVPHADSSKADLLHREIGRRVRNRVFEKSFKMASNLLQQI